MKKPNGGVVTYYLSPEELEQIRLRPRKRYYDDDNRRAIEWRWPTTRRKKR
ncbi:hypothetical protein [uncultured Anoxybacillus sp.]|uniref:hypothetical protein n=1 Tax=uncultured Anoxybacillus sp. TaxID=263860 RepID=UPI0026225A9C|nr:hypothetical protein [uncultured Anoxybacillus sp.]